jgi:hypothetical protein
VGSGVRWEHVTGRGWQLQSQNDQLHEMGKYERTEENEEGGCYTNRVEK